MKLNYLLVPKGKKQEIYIALSDFNPLLPTFHLQVTAGPPLNIKVVRESNYPSYACNMELYRGSHSQEVCRQIMEFVENNLLDLMKKEHLLRGLESRPLKEDKKKAATKEERSSSVPHTDTAG